MPGRPPLYLYKGDKVDQGFINILLLNGADYRIRNHDHTPDAVLSDRIHTVFYGNDDALVKALISLEVSILDVLVIQHGEGSKADAPVSIFVLERNE